jgi:GNAT superfamily N-acetyltransferase
MLQPLTFQQVLAVPSPAASTATLRNGERVLFRPLQKDDALRLGRYFAGLSQDTVGRFGPHEFTYAKAQELCDQIGQETIIRLIVLTGADPEESEQAEVIGYFLLECTVGESDQDRYVRYGIALDPATACKFAPSVADRYQDSGLGSIVFAKIADLARSLGFQRMILMGGVYITNDRAIRYYEKNGFRKMGRFQEETSKESFDMIVSL